MQMKNRFFTADFTDSAFFLKDRTKGFVFKGEDATKLAEILKFHDRCSKSQEGWCSTDPSSQYNMNGATVLYNGANSSSFRTNAKFSHVLELSIPNMKGCRLYLQYNVEGE